jgi:hypothetical protein
MNPSSGQGNSFQVMSRLKAAITYGDARWNLPTFGEARAASGSG